MTKPPNWAFGTAPRQNEKGIYWPPVIAIGLVKHLNITISPINISDTRIITSDFFKKLNNFQTFIPSPLFFSYPDSKITIFTATFIYANYWL